MGMNLSRNTKRGRSRLISEINITPMVDVMLVLLIIFMITSPMMVAGIEVDLPETSASPMTGDSKPLVISIDKAGDVYILETKIAASELVAKLENITNEKKDTRIFIKGDKNVSYGKIVETMAEISSAGFTKVALISEIKHK